MPAWAPAWAAATHLVRCEASEQSLDSLAFRRLADPFMCCADHASSGSSGGGDSDARNMAWMRTVLTMQGRRPYLDALSQIAAGRRDVALAEACARCSAADARVQRELETDSSKDSVRRVLLAVKQTNVRVVFYI